MLTDNMSKIIPGADASQRRAREAAIVDATCALGRVEASSPFLRCNGQSDLCGLRAYMSS